MPKNIAILLRHGESIWNKENRFAGWVDVDLSEFGKEQAKTAGKLLKEGGFVFDAAFTSVLKRAVNTLEIVLGEIGQKDILIEKSWQLNERHYGLLQGINKQEAVERFGIEQVMAWRRGYKVRPPELKTGDPPRTESLEDVYLRVVPYWQEKIAPLIAQGKLAIISAHGNSLRALVKMLDNISDKDIESLNIPTGMPLVYEFDENLKPLKHYYLGNEEDVNIAIRAVENQIKK